MLAKRTNKVLFNYALRSKPGLLQQFVADFNSGQLHQDFHRDQRSTNQLSAEIDIKNPLVFTLSYLYMVFIYSYVLCSIVHYHVLYHALIVIEAIIFKNELLYLMTIINCKFSRLVDMVQHIV